MMNFSLVKMSNGKIQVIKEAINISWSFNAACLTSSLLHLIPACLYPMLLVLVWRGWFANLVLVNSWLFEMAWVWHELFLMHSDVDRGSWRVQVLIVVSLMLQLCIAKISWSQGNGSNWWISGASLGWLVWCVHGFLQGDFILTWIASS